MSGPQFAHTVRIVQDEGADVDRAAGQVFEIDGQVFPWYVSVDGFKVGDVARGTVPSITVTILAERLELVHALFQAEPEIPEVIRRGAPPPGPAVGDVR